jgi:hypothetical protein
LEKILSTEFVGSFVHFERVVWTSNSNILLKVAI